LGFFFGASSPSFVDRYVEKPDAPGEAYTDFLAKGDISLLAAANDTILTSFVLPSHGH
jgi:hypothetical protein